MAQLVEQAASTSSAGSSSPTSASSGSDVNRVTVFLHSLFFVAGFTVVFVLLGVFASALPYEVTIWLQQVGAVLLFVLALSMLGLFRWGARKIRESFNIDSNPPLGMLVGAMDFLNNILNSERRVVEIHSVNKSWGYLSSFIIGLSFAAGWTPCIGPILGGILGLASSTGNSFGGTAPSGSTIAQGATLLAIYSFGLGIPFLIVGAAFNRASKFLRRINRYSNVVGVISGILLLIISGYLWTGSLTALAGQIPGLGNLVFLLENSVISLETTMIEGLGIGDIKTLNMLAAAPVALFAGLLSFVSPCVLPLVPAYIGYLSGASLSK